MTLTLPAYSFVQAMRFALATAGKTDTRYYLNGVCLERDRIIGTDGHRASWVLTDWQFGDQRILERAGVELMVKAFKPKRGGVDEVELTLYADHVAASYAGVSTRVELLDGKFPDMDRVWPRWIDSPEPPDVLGLNARYLTDAGRQCDLLANAKYHGVRLYTDAAGVALTPNIVLEDLPGITGALTLISPIRL